MLIKLTLASTNRVCEALPLIIRALNQIDGKRSNEVGAFQLIKIISMIIINISFCNVLFAVHTISHDINIRIHTLFKC